MKKPVRLTSVVCLISRSEIHFSFGSVECQTFLPPLTGKMRLYSCYGQAKFVKAMLEIEDVLGMETKDLNNFCNPLSRFMNFICYVYLDSNVDVIYVSPVSINDETLQYYNKLLGLRSAVETGSVDSQKDMSSRFTIIIPESVNSFPVSFTSIKCRLLIALYNVQYLQLNFWYMDNFIILCIIQA